MTEILEFIKSQYISFIIWAIIIVLAIIGRYAEKTNFGQSKSDKDIENELKKINNEKLKKENSILKENKPDNKELKQQENKIDDNSHKVEKEKTDDTAVEMIKEDKTKNNNKKSKKKSEQSQSNFEKQYDILNNEINFLLPEKKIINEGLLEDIDSLSLDKTQKIDFSIIPDLDDVDLPKIKKLNEDSDKIWK